MSVRYEHTKNEVLSILQEAEDQPWRMHDGHVKHLCHIAMSALDDAEAAEKKYSDLLDDSLAHGRHMAGTILTGLMRGVIRPVASADAE